MKFKVGDKVRSRQLGQEYTGEIRKIGSTTVEVFREDRDGIWDCKIVGDRVATAYGMWDGKSFLELLEEEGKKTHKPTKFVVFYEVNKVDPMKEFSDKKDLLKWLSEASKDTRIDFQSIKVFEIAGELKITTKFSLRKV